MSTSPLSAAEVLSRAWVGDPERPWGSARPEWLAARDGGTQVRQDETTEAAVKAGEELRP